MPVRLWSLYALILVAVTQSSCVHMSASDCRSGDWKAYGFTDAFDGDLADKQPARIKACREMGAEPDLASYALGAKDGQKAYCSPMGGWHIGIHGWKYQSNSCPRNSLGAALQGYDLAYEVYSTEWDYDDALRRRENNHDDARREGGSSRARSERRRDYDEIDGTTRADLLILQLKADKTYSRNIATFVRLFGFYPQ